MKDEARERDKALDRIKKLLRMKRGGTPEEVATALRIAQEIADRHGILIGEVDLDDDRPASETMGHDEPISGARIQCEVRLSGMICEQFFRVLVFTRQRGWYRAGRGRKMISYALVIVGANWDRVIAIYVLHFLARRFRDAWREQRGRLRNREAFMWGVYCGVAARLKDLQPPVETPRGEGLIVADRRLAYTKTHFGDLTGEDVRPDTKARAAEFAGWIAGRKTEIKSGLEGPRNQTPRLPAAR